MRKKRYANILFFENVYYGITREQVSYLFNCENVMYVGEESSSFKVLKRGSVTEGS